MDMDLHCRTSVWPLIHVNTTFVTVVEFDGSKNFFQAFIAVTPRHAIIKRYLDLFLKHYKGELKTKKKDKVNFKKGTVLLRIAHRQVIAEQPDLVSLIQLWKEARYNQRKFAHIEKPPGPTPVASNLALPYTPSSPATQNPNLQVLSEPRPTAT